MIPRNSGHIHFGWSLFKHSFSIMSLIIRSLPAWLPSREAHPITSKTWWGSTQDVPHHKWPNPGSPINLLFPDSPTPWQITKWLQVLVTWRNGLLWHTQLGKASRSVWKSTSSSFCQDDKSKGASLQRVIALEDPWQSVRVKFEIVHN